MVTLGHLVFFLSFPLFHSVTSNHYGRLLPQGVTALNMAEGIGVDQNTLEVLKRGRARLYYDAYFQGPFESFNMGENKENWTDCMNLNSTVAGHVHSIDSFKTCVQLFEQQDCQGQRVDILGGHEEGNGKYDSHTELSFYVNFPVYSIGSCYPRPRNRQEYPGELRKGILENKKDNEETKEVVEQLENRIDELQDELEHLELRSLGTIHSELEKWDACGGFISLHRGAQLSYQNVGRGNTSQSEESDFTEETCVWVISTKKPGGGPMSFTLRDMTLSNQTGSPGLLSIQKEFSSKFISSQLLQLEDLQKEVRINQPTVILVFISVMGQGFKLRIMDVGSPSSSLYGDYGMSPHSIHGVSTGVYLGGSWANGNESSNGTVGVTFTHPFTGEQYSSNERRHIIIRSIPGKRIHLSVDFVDTELNGDYLNVFKFSRIDQKFIFLHKFSGPLGVLENATFNGDENEPFFLYFYSDSSVEFRGFEIFFSYLTGEMEPQRTQLQHPFVECGGFVRLPNYTEITYQNTRKGNGPFEETCIWFIHASSGGPIKLTLTESQFDHSKKFSSPSLTLHFGFGDSSSTKSRQISQADQGMDILEDEMNMIIIFKSTEPNQGFNLKLKDLRKARWRTSMEAPNVTFIRNEKDGQISHLSYPPSVAQENNPANYSKDESQFFIILPSAKTQVLLSLDYVDTQPHGDFIQVFKFDKKEKKFQFNGRFSGRIGKLDNSSHPPVYEGGLFEPILLFFRSNSYINGHGFKFSYVYQPGVKEGVKVDPLTIFGHNASLRTVDKFEECGGYVTLDTEKMLTVKSGPNDPRPQVCIWIVTTMSGGVIGLTPLSQNFDTSSLSILDPNFVTVQNSSKILPRFINETDLNSEVVHEVVHEDSSVVIIYTRTKSSSPTSAQNFVLRLRELGQVKSDLDTLILGMKTSRLKVNGTLERLQAGSNGSFSYPPPPLKKYDHSQQYFVALYPASGQNLTLNVNYIDMDDTYDFLSVLKFSAVLQRFEFVRRLTGHIGDVYTNSFKGDLNSPLLVYFQSGHYTHGKGFKISYSSSVGSLGSSKVKYSAPCGALVPVDTQVDFFYQNPGYQDINETRGNETDLHQDDTTTCVWVMAPSTGGPLAVTLKEFDFGNSTTSLSRLTLQGQFANQSNTTTRFIGKSDLGRRIILVNETSMLLISSTKKEQSFLLQIELDSSSSSDSNLTSVLDHSPPPLASANILDASPSTSIHTTFSHPDSFGDYKSNERRHIIVRSIPGMRISLSVTYVDMERNHDFLNVFRYSKEEGKFVFLQTYSGYLGSQSYSSYSYNKFLGEENQPFFLYFESDRSVQRSGFRLFYFYETPPPLVTSTTNQTELIPVSHGPNIIDYDPDNQTHDHHGDHDHDSVWNRCWWNDTQPYGLVDLWDKFRIVSRNLKDHLEEKFETIKETPGWVLSVMILVSILSSCTSVGLFSYFMWQQKQKRKATVKKTVIYARTGTREAVLLGDQDDQDTML